MSRCTAIQTLSTPDKKLAVSGYVNRHQRRCRQQNWSANRSEMSNMDTAPKRTTEDKAAVRPVKASPGSNPGLAHNRGCQSQSNPAETLRVAMSAAGIKFNGPIH